MDARIEKEVGAIIQLTRDIQAKFAAAGLGLSPGDSLPLAVELNREKHFLTDCDIPADADVPAQTNLAGQDATGNPGVEPARA